MVRSSPSADRSICAQFLNVRISFALSRPYFADGLSRADRTGGADSVHMLPPAVQRHRCAAQVLLVPPPLLPEVHQLDFDEERRTVLRALLEANGAAGARYEAGEPADAHGDPVLGAEPEHAEHEAEGAGQTAVGGESAAGVVAAAADAARERERGPAAAEQDDQEGRELPHARHAERAVVPEVPHDDLSGVRRRRRAPQPHRQDAQRGKGVDSRRHCRRAAHHAEDARRRPAPGAQAARLPSQDPRGEHRAQDANRNGAHQPHTDT